MHSRAPGLRRGTLTSMFWAIGGGTLAEAVSGCGTAAVAVVMAAVEITAAGSTLLVAGAGSDILEGDRSVDCPVVGNEVLVEEDIGADTGFIAVGGTDTGVGSTMGGIVAIEGTVLIRTDGCTLGVGFETETFTDTLLALLFIGAGGDAGSENTGEGEAFSSAVAFAEAC